MFAVQRAAVADDQDKIMRRIVQITGVQATIAALCDDGSVWLCAFDIFEERHWEQLPDIPQPRKDTLAKEKAK
jgi:hypothetical protein